MENKGLPTENSTRSEQIRRRRRKHSFFSGEEGEREALLEELGQRLLPRFDFLLFSLVSGLAIGIAIFTDSLPILVLALALTPFLAPVLGIAFGIITGSTRFFLRVLAGLLFGSLLAFAGSFLIGWVSKSWVLGDFSLAGEISVFSWTSLAVLLAGVVPTVIFTIRGEMTKASTIGLVLVFFIYLPLGISAFGFARGISSLWPQSLYLFLVYFSWTVITGIFTFAAFSLKPKSLAGYLLGAIFLLGGCAGLLFVNVAPLEMAALPQMEWSTSTVMPVEESDTPLPALATHTAEAPPSTPSAVPSRTNTPVPSLSPTITITPMPTSVFALINAEGNGAIVRLEPDLNAPAVNPALTDGTEVKVLPETFEKGKILWVRIRTIEGKEGWILQELLATMTPVPE